MWSIIKSHFHKGKTGFVITGLFVILSVLMMIVGLSICLGMSDLYTNIQKVTNSSDMTFISYNNMSAFEKLINELSAKYPQDIQNINKSELIYFSDSSNKYESYFEYRFSEKSNLSSNYFLAINLNDEANEYRPRIRDCVSGEGYKIYVSGNTIATSSNLKVGTAANFVYKGTVYKGYIAGIYDSMSLIYSQAFCVEQDFYNLLENLMKTDDDFKKEDLFGIRFKYKDEKECEQLIAKWEKEILTESAKVNLFAKENEISYNQLNKITFVNATKSFITILGSALIAFSVLIALIAALVIAFLVRSSVMDEVRNLGVLKALGYTTTMLRLSYLAIYGVIAGVCMLVGIILGVSLMPTFVNVLTSMARIDCTKCISLNVGSIFVGIALILTVISAIIMLASGRIKRITPLSAMRNNFETHSFKRNFASLAKSKMPVNGALGFKSVLGETGRSVMVVVVVLIMSFLCAFTSVAFYNLKVDQTAIVNMSAIEVADWYIGFNAEDNPEQYYEALRQMDGYVDDRIIIHAGGTVNDNYLQGIFYSHFDGIRTNLVYEGRLPKYKNEVMLMVDYAKDSGYEIGDTIVIDYNATMSPETASVEMTVVGYFQTLTNYGNYIAFLDSIPDYKIHFATFLSIGARYWYFEEGKVPTQQEIVNHVCKVVGVNRLIFNGCMTGDSIVKNQLLNTIETAADAVLAVFVAITAIVIILLLVMLIKLKLMREKRNYAIYKAIGYTTPNIMTQIAVAMVILSVIGALIGAIAGGLLTTPMLSLVGGIVGVGRFAFVIPWGYIVGIIFGVPMLTYLVSMLCAVPVRKIAPATLLRERG